MKVALAFATSLAVLLTVASNVGAQHAGHGTAAATPPGGSAAQAPSTKAVIEANDKMHKDMAIASTGDADVDFTRGMIAHHDGAVAMAKVVLAYGKDATTRKLAAGIIKAQKSEIVLMKAWLDKNGK